MIGIMKYLAISCQYPALEKDIIYSGFGLEMRKLGCILSFCLIRNDKI